MQDAIVISGKTIRAFIVGMTNKLNIDFLIRLAGRFLMNGSQFGTNRPPTVTHPVHHGVFFHAAPQKYLSQRDLSLGHLSVMRGILQSPLTNLLLITTTGSRT